jgi:1-acyl-sn-glycerol-3-phosphate acyltransferase
MVSTLLARRLTVTGDSGLRPTEGALVVCNHQSWLDPLLLMAWTRSNGLSKSQILYIPVIGLYGWLAGTVFFDRKSKDGRSRARREVLQLALAGNRIHVFPEGTRTRHVRPREQVYLRLIFDCHSRGIPVVPCAVVGTDEALPPGRFGVWPFAPVRLEIGTAMRPADHATASAFATACWEDVRRRHAALLEAATTSR